MGCVSTFNGIDWNPILNQMDVVNNQGFPTYPGDLKAALLDHVGLSHHPKGEELYQLAQQVAQLTTCCDPEIVYWFSRLVPLIQ
jgi:hypothetical protein